VEPASPLPNSPDTQRRGFLAAAGAAVIGAVISLTPVAAGIAFFLDPILRRRTPFIGGDADGFLPVTSLADLPDDGTPLRFVLRADKLDAWNKFTNQTIGTVYLRKMPGNQIIAFSDTCPHLGCKVDYQEGKQEFLCPCHASAFELGGKPLNKIPPRGLDVLKSKVDSTDKVWVKYQEFRSGIEKQEAVG
jgi:nitrite reductase/ring-hydroxylating ferredoxin subunit